MTMRFHGCLEQVLGSKAAIRILRMMIRYQAKVFTKRGLARTADVSANEAALTIHDLEDIGIVKVQPVGRSHQLSLNKKSFILNRIVRPAFKAEEDALSELAKVLKKSLDGKAVVSAALFGSVVTGRERPDSDVDILIISDDFSAAAEAVSGALAEAAEVFHARIAPIIISQKELRSKKKGGLIRSIVSDHIMVCGRDLEGMMK